MALRIEQSAVVYIGRNGCMGENRGSSSHSYKPHPAKLQVVPAVDLARVFTNLTPSIPLSFKGEGFHPSLTYTPPSLAKGRGSGGRVTKQSPCNV